MRWSVPPVSRDREREVRHFIDNKTKPIGSLGMLESAALQLALIQGKMKPRIVRPSWLVFAGDHGITAEGVSSYPSAVTRQMVLNFISGGAAINVFARLHGIDLKIVDAGIAGDVPSHPNLIDRKIAMGTANFLVAPAMTLEQCETALATGEHLVETLAEDGCNTVGFGEMGIGNTSSAAVLMHLMTGLPLESCVGRGTGLDESGVARKLAILEQAAARVPHCRTPLAALQQYGGFELAMICGGMLAAARLGMSIVVDGFIVTAALLVAQKISPPVLDYCFFGHCSNERGHRDMLRFLDRKSLLQLDMRLGEGTGAALAIPILRAACAFMSDMASFDDAGVSRADE
ncbi:nicotinate-nucleotide--dimethylbenzimidazole phosphoribosyltransferase [Sulfidibacter corallicola]|uniref:Nicotinate-nucleotide--dimethylbenzimidazole phosphoribosyltransferase n=1 Tax=Sulfidibacter corallicola TaxID=2818388 RepID=A0A8A4TTJ3_SULCO|nr:nicotinate-nucleotide--dimethylbenzimidazole phosphoribosyltransferase [Sulfidibacter corallicola]QTD52391.1 nicotinate-nucleotide--dimethylbenzimidazole phosphoribosyltransferase [Sulfidibacter corallicola]